MRHLLLLGNSLPFLLLLFLLLLLLLLFFLLSLLINVNVTAVIFRSNLFRIHIEADLHHNANEVTIVNSKKVYYDVTNAIQRLPLVPNSNRIDQSINQGSKKSHNKCIHCNECYNIVAIGNN